MFIIVKLWKLKGYRDRSEEDGVEGVEEIQGIFGGGELERKFCIGCFGDGGEREIREEKCIWGEDNEFSFSISCNVDFVSRLIGIFGVGKRGLISSRNIKLEIQDGSRSDWSQKACL